MFCEVKIEIVCIETTVIIETKSNIKRLMYNKRLALARYSPQ